MRYPYDRFLRFLVSRKANVSLVMDRYGLPNAGGMWEAECRSAMREAAPYSVSSFIDSDEETVVRKDGFLEWAEGQGFRELWESQPEFGSRPLPPHVDEAHRLFLAPVTRAVMGLLILSRATPSEAIEVMRERFDEGISEDTLRTYTRLFWDPTGVRASFWTKLVEILKTSEERHLIAAGLSNPDISRVRMFIGLDDPVDRDFIINDVIRKCYTRFKQAMEAQRPEDHAADKWAAILHKYLNSPGAPGAPGSGGGTPGEDVPISTDNLGSLFSVQIERTRHVRLDELNGSVSHAPEHTPENSDPS